MAAEGNAAAAADAAAAVKTNGQVINRTSVPFNCRFLPPAPTARASEVGFDPFLIELGARWRMRGHLGQVRWGFGNS